METSRLLLRAFVPEDWQDLFEYLSSEEVVRFEPYSVFTPQQCRQEAIRRSKSTDFYAVCLKKSGKLIGNMSLTPTEFNTWELGYVFNCAYWGRGYAFEAAGAIISHAFLVLRAHRIIALCNPSNISSWRLLERLGLRRESHMMQNIYFDKDPQGLPLWQDTYQYAILQQEWPPVLCDFEA